MCLETVRSFIKFKPKPNARFNDIEGKKFGKLTVLGYSGSDRAGNALWYCQCECQNVVISRSASLRRGGTKSCGCLTIERNKSRRIVPHNARKEYNAFIGARDRCNNPRSEHYADYGGRGIKFNFQSFQEFLDCVGYAPSKEYSLDRVDVNGHYEKENLRWATKTIQTNNRRMSIKVTALGNTLSIEEWSEISGLSYKRIYDRIKRLHWCEDCAVTIPAKLPTCTHLKK